jgi:truncated hemoglobin YjbI
MPIGNQEFEANLKLMRSVAANMSDEELAARLMEIVARPQRKFRPYEKEAFLTEAVMRLRKGLKVNG